MNVTPEYPVFGLVYVGGLLLVTDPDPMDSVDREVGCESCCSGSRGGGGRRNADFGLLMKCGFRGGNGGRESFLGC